MPKSVAQDILETHDASLLLKLRAFVLFQPPYAWAYYLCLALYCAASCRALKLSKPTLKHAHAIPLAILTSFGGGILVPITLGKPMVLHANESVLPIMLCAYTCVNFLPGVFSLLSTRIGKLISTTGFEIFRYHVLAGCSDLANRTLPQPMGGGYPVAIVGPLVAGLLGGCGGAFMPLSTGLSPIENGLPWRVQSALIATFYHHFATHDPNAREWLVKFFPMFVDEAWVRFGGIVFFAAVPLCHVMGANILGANPFWPQRQLKAKKAKGD